jgi:thermitase
MDLILSRGKSMSHFRTTLKLLSALTLMSSCAGNFESNSANVSALSLGSPSGLDSGTILPIDGASEKVQIDIPTIAAQDSSFASVNRTTVLESVGRASLTANKSVRLPKGTKLVAVIDNRCVSQRAQTASLSAESYSARLASVDESELSLQAYDMSIESDQTVGDLSAVADRDPCLVTISNDMTFHADATPNDPYFANQAQMKAISAASAFDTFFGASGGITSDVVIAIVDSGVDLTHPDLKANLWSDRSGANGFDFANRDTDPSDDNGHGTHVAGLAAAVRDNGVGVSGVMGSHAKIMAVKVIGADGSGSSTAIVNGMLYAVQNGAQVINMSLGGQGKSSAYQAALQDAVSKGVTVVVAAGNDSLQLSTTTWVSPGSYGSAINGMITVGSIDASTLARSSFSNYSPTYVELGAPGSGSIVSTYPGGRYATMQGTSMASPIVAGAAALTIGLLKSRGYQVTPALVESLLTSSGTASAGLTSYFKEGRYLNLQSLASMLNSKYPAGGGASVPVATPTPRPVAAATPTPTPTPRPVATPTPAPAPSTGGCDVMSSSEACRVYQLINSQRQRAGLTPLAILSRCELASQEHAQDMATNQYFSHDGLAETWTERMQRFSLTSSTVGENIAYGYTADSVVTAWMGSAGHRANILNSRFRSTGLGLAYDKSGRPFWVQCFSGLSGDR